MCLETIPSPSVNHDGRALVICSDLVETIISNVYYLLELEALDVKIRFVFRRPKYTKMPTGCCLSYCHNNHLDIRNFGISFHRFPENLEVTHQKIYLKKDAVPSLSFGGNEESDSEKENQQASDETFKSKHNEDRRRCK
ncbi:hypothetical protein NQ317_002531 [Molorchus minor]|uniref:Uncharacterized protein n=1 Tax=Molorchus minor TaxID=1323400 RepID=A0ABQ9IV65_9CUCU|nr:hypothetical protein NQ317_002531 [Molorchus minor]